MFSTQPLHKVVLQVQTIVFMKCMLIDTINTRCLSSTDQYEHYLHNGNEVQYTKARVTYSELSRLNGKVLCTKISKAHQNIKNRAFKMFDTKT